MNEQHLLAAVRYVERNPVRACLCARPEGWPWSSAAAHLAGRDDARVSVRPLLELVPDGEAFSGAADDEKFNDLLRGHAHTGRPLGADPFVESLERLLGRHALARPALPGVIAPNA